MAWALHRGDADRNRDTVHRAADWLRGLQCKGGGFASFDADNTCSYLNDIPFADHGALLDPPTADVSARCVTLFARLDRKEDKEALNRSLDYLAQEQEQNGSWYGRWGTNYIYGTWTVLTALEQVGDKKRLLMVRRAAEWLKSIQRPDGSWGEGNDTYFYPERAGQGSAGTACQTAWAVLGLLAAGTENDDAVHRGVQRLLETQGEDGSWQEECHNAPGFPRAFFLRYHGYSLYFPAWALARYARSRH